MNNNNSLEREQWAKDIIGKEYTENNFDKFNMDSLRRNVMGLCKHSKLKKRLPILTWLPKYNLDDFIGDSIAGLTVGLTVIPQGIAYALIAGLPPNYGLNAAFFGLFLYVIFGSCKDITIGPTAVLSILTHEYINGDPELANLLSFTSGILILLFGMLNLGFLIAFISKPVIVGFTSAAALTIFTSQLNGLFGLKVETDGLVDSWVQVISHIKETRWQDLTLGLSCIVILLLMKKMRELPRFKKDPNDTFSQKALKMTVFLISVGRNAIVVIIATFISAVLDDNQPFTITGEIQPGLPSFQPPQFSFANGTVGFFEAMKTVGSGVIILPLIAILENIAIGSAFSQGKTIDATQEMIALGICNIGNSFFQGMPSTGSFSRTAVNATSGVRTTAGGIVTGVIVILALAVLTPYFRYIPLSTLAAVIICAVIFMVEYDVIMPIWRTRKLDQLVLWTSFLVCIFWKLEYGIVLGIIINVFIVLLVEANPKSVVELKLEGEDSGVSTPRVGYWCPPHVVVTPRTGLLFFNEDKIRNRITKAGLKEASGILPVVVDCSHFSVVDYSASKGMQSLATDFGRRGQPLIFTKTTPGVKNSLKAINPQANIVEDKDLIALLSGNSTQIGTYDVEKGTPSEKIPLIAKGEIKLQNNDLSAAAGKDGIPIANGVCEKSLVHNGAPNNIKV